MDKKLKNKIGNQRELMNLLGIGRTQAWKIWTGKANLTTINERYLKLVLKIEEE